MFSLFVYSLVIVTLTAAWPSGAVRPPGNPPDDSTATRKRAERLQQAFERTRLEHLPWSYGSSGPCDLRIGRYCFTFDDDRDYDPPPDHVEVITAREELVRALDSSHALLPGDEWILTQLVRYAVESGQHEVAKRAASTCELSHEWLCHALLGYIHHIGEEYVESESAFERSLAVMTVQQRCDWEDLSELITGGIRGQWRDRDCAERSGLLDTLLWLSDPLYLVPGNELRTEHLSRHVASLMLQQARGPDRERWNRVVHTIIIRYGWPTGWQRRREYHTSIRPPMITHYGSDGSATFLPTTRIVSDPTSVAIDDWDLDPDRPQSSHGPRYAREAFEQLDVSWAMFRRGDSTTLVGITSLSHERLSHNDETAFAIALSRDPSTPTRVWSDVVHDTTHALTATSMASPHLVSVEALARSVGVAGRARFGLDLGRLHQPNLVVSDVLVLRPTDSLPNNLTEAIPLIRKPHHYRPGEQFVLYWELYGVGPEGAYATSISLDKTSKGLFRRLAEITPFASHRPAVRVAWDDRSRTMNTTARRAVAVDLPRELSDGRYRLTLAIEGPNGERIDRSIALTVQSH